MYICMLIVVLNVEMCLHVCFESIVLHDSFHVKHIHVCNWLSTCRLFDYFWEGSQKSSKLETFVFQAGSHSFQVL